MPEKVKGKSSIPGDPSGDREHIVPTVDMEKCKDLGAAMFVSKPASFGELFNKMLNILNAGVK